MDIYPPDLNDIKDLLNMHQSIDLNERVNFDPSSIYNILYICTIPQLKTICKGLTIKGYSKCKTKIRLLNYISKNIFKNNHIEFDTLNDYKSYITSNES